VVCPYHEILLHIKKGWSADEPPKLFSECRNPVTIDNICMTPFI
jgi:hypothetical protein